MWHEVQRNLRSWKTYKDRLKTVVEKRESTFAPWYLMKVKLLERLISKKELMLMLLLPTLRLSVQDVINQNVYHFIFSSHFELESWKDLIEENNYPYNELSVLLDYVKNFCQIPQMTLQKYMSSPFSYVNGTLEVHIHQVRDLDTDIEAFITLQVDSFGGYFNRIYTTNISECSNCPIFDERFDIPLSCSQHLKICFYKKDPMAMEFELFSTGIFDIWKESLTADYRLVTIPLFMRDTLQEKIIPEIDIDNPIESFYTHKPHQKTVVALTLRLISKAEYEIKENPQVFGKSIKETITREGMLIPLIVTSCIKEIEKRGLDQESLYISKGNTLNVCRLYQAFEHCSNSAVELIQNQKYTIHDISQLLLWYIKTLPISLLQCPDSFILLYDIYNETRKEIALRSLICQLPMEERRVLFCLLDHFVKVCRHIGNKITPTAVGRILCAVFYDLEGSEKTSEYRKQQNKFVSVMEYIVYLRLEGISLYTN
ncbi:breakpoint cluster region protein [Octopus bimaculoides]|uniref:Uncharacterized protein n=1 Tax=Octopus bimaculoides TaxID=37653 RepID=A0A0L8GCM0_OCTBM|nr:breakpoint cluster region protein [Octopus bimaculoides]|eukprot:XP_014782258.1 PREDICTED: breakpoint cluster region protein-like [Octopus bimaculoides]